MKFKTDLYNSKSFIRPHVCHHYGVPGHIRPNCFKFYPQKHMSKLSQVSSQGPIPLFGELLKALNILTQFQALSILSSWPKTHAVWVRKEPKT